MEWDVKTILSYLNSELAARIAQRKKSQIELNCLSKEIDGLEDMIFKIERESIEKEEG